MRYLYYISVVVLVLPVMFSCGGGNDEDSSEDEVQVNNSISNASSSQQGEVVEPSLDDDEITDRDAFLKGVQPTPDMLNQILDEFQTGQRSFDFYAVFTEPFWTVYFFGHHALFMAMDWETPQLLPLEYPFNPDTFEEQTLRFAMNGELWEVNVKRERGSDGMSEISYPYSVEYDMLTGGGATKLMKE